MNDTELTELVMDCGGVVDRNPLSHDLILVTFTLDGLREFMDNVPPAAIEASDRPGLLVRFFAWLTGGEVVWIQDYQGKVLATIAKMDAFGGSWCPVFWFTRTGRCQLLPNGTVDPASESSYVLRWRKAE